MVFRALRSHVLGMIMTFVDRDWGPATLLENEQQLYEPVRSYLDVGFYSAIKPERGTLFLAAEITSSMVSGPGGQWSNPDLCAVALWQRKYNPQIGMDLYGFEVKPAARCDLRSVHEALAHTRFVHFSYLVWNWPIEDRTGRYVEIEESCRGHGIGLIIVYNPSNPQLYQRRLVAERKSPDPDIVDHFVEDKFSDHTKTIIHTKFPRLG